MASAATVTVLSTVTALAASSSTSSAAATAAPQAGVLEGMNPSAYNAKDPIILFIIQASIIIIFCRLLYFPLKYLGQPRVISEVIGGIVLGPSVMARIPGFRAAIFPTESMPVLSNVANLGLIIFMFITALEVDLRLFVENWRVALSVGLAGMLLPFGLGCAIALGIYNQFKADMTNNINFGVFALFIGTALAITAFPVLCRILTELKLLGTSVGVTVLAAGVGNDVVGWILLALCVSLTNNASGLSALYALLCCVAWILFLVYAVRPAFLWILRRNGSLQDGPSPGMVTLTLLMVLTSSFFTGIIGVHPIFGGFLVGLITPHEGGFAIKLTQKIEDFVGVLFLPLYFALSGLNTNIGLLNDGMVWAYVIAVIVIAFTGKIVGGTLAARSCGLLWRESASIGVLMSCKGLVELIVLNIGLQAGILSQRTFTMFVLMALVTTVATTPLTKALYPPWYQKKLERWRRGEIDWDGKPLITPDAASSLEKLHPTHIRRVLVYLRLDSLPSLFTFIALLGGTINHDKVEKKDAPPSTEEGPTEEDLSPSPPHPQQPPSHKERPLEVHGLRILELTDRTSSVMQVTEGSDLSETDPIVNAFRTFSQLNEVAVSGQVAIVPTNSYAETLMSQASEVSSDFVLIPWSTTGSMGEDQFAPTPVSLQQRFNDRPHLDFVNQALQRAGCNAGVFINNGFGGGGAAQRPPLTRNISRISMRSGKEQATLLVTDRRHHLFFPFLGGADDRVALRFVLQLAKNPLLTVTIAHVSWDEDKGAADSSRPSRQPFLGTPHPGERVRTGTTPKPVSQDSSAPTSPNKSPVMHRGSRGAAADEDEGDDGEVNAEDLAVLSAMRSSLPAELAGRVAFTELSSTSGEVVGATLEMASRTVGSKKSRRNAGDIVVVGRLHRRLGDTPTDYFGGAGLDLRRTLGAVGERLVLAQSLNASLLVIQAGRGDVVEIH